MTVRHVPLLSIEASGGVLRYRLELSERDRSEPLQEESRQTLDERILATLQEQADTVLRGAEGPGFARDASTVGAVLYRTLVPPRLRDQLRAVSGPLLISTSLYGLPWELLHDGEEFWGLRYALGKRLVLERRLPAAASVPVLRARPRALVVGSDPRDDLPFVRHEVDVVCDALAAHADVTCVAGRLATFETVVAHLGAGFDLVHYCGHVVPGPGGSPALLLAAEAPLPATVIEANLGGRPLVFLNGCASARGAAAPAGTQWAETASSLAYGFLFGGALAAVGTLSDVSDRHAATIAGRFYRGVMEGLPIGEALRAARAACRSTPGSADSPAWLSFVLHGNPSQALPRGGRAEPSRPVPAPTPVHAAPAAASPRTRGPEPTIARAQRPARRALLGILALAVTALVAAGVYRQTRRVPAGPVIVGVMEVRARGAGASEPVRELTRDTLNTVLSKFPALRVYSRQKIDFVRQRRQLGEIEAAEALGMTKMLSTTVAMDRQSVVLEMDIVDIRTGLLDASERVEGTPDELMQLEADFALRAVAALGVTPTSAEAKAIRTDHGSATLGAYQLFKDTLGAPPAGEPAPAPDPAPAPPPDTSWLGGVAFAQEPGRDEVAVRALLERYAAALQAKDVERLAALQVEMSGAQRTSLARYFGIADDLRVRISDVDVLLEGDEALATFTRADTFRDHGTGRDMRLEVRVSGILRRDGGEWRIVGLRDPE